MLVISNSFEFSVQLNKENHSKHYIHISHKQLFDYKGNNVQMIFMTLQEYNGRFGEKMPSKLTSKFRYAKHCYFK